jgi:preprotein translocase subunit SecF
MLIAAVNIFLFGLKQGIDFTGGTLWQVRFSDPKISVEKLNELLTKDLKQTDFAVNTNISDNSYFIRLKEVNESDHQQYLKKINEKLGSVEELSFESIGAAVGLELRNKSIWAFLLVLFTISLYIAFVFRKVSRPVSSWKYGLITLLTLFHDAVIPVGLIAYLGYSQGLEIGVNFIVAILVVMGFSVHVTIVVFDRIRENLKL